jgi:hypothetical protein
MRAGWLTASLSSTGQQPWPGTHGGSNNASVPDIADRQRTHRGHAEAGNRGAARPSGTRRAARPVCARSRRSAAALPRPDDPARIRLSGGQVVDNDDGIGLDHTLEQGNPADAPQLAPAIERVVARTGHRPRTVTADRGYGEKGIDEALHQMGVRTVVIPRKGTCPSGKPECGGVTSLGDRFPGEPWGVVCEIAQEGPVPQEGTPG